MSYPKLLPTLAMLGPQALRWYEAGAALWPLLGLAVPLIRPWGLRRCGDFPSPNVLGEDALCEFCLCPSHLIAIIRGLPSS